MDSSHFTWLGFVLVVLGLEFFVLPNITPGATGMLLVALLVFIALHYGYRFYVNSKTAKPDA